MSVLDLYSQVASLFHSAPDLLEEFKQFLPELAIQAESTPGQLMDGTSAGHPLANDPSNVDEGRVEDATPGELSAS